MATSLTSGVNYNLKPVSLKCTRKTVVVPSSNKTSFSPQDTIVLYLPSLKDHVMDGQSGYLRFQVTVTGDGFLDHSAHSFIDRITTYGAGGQVISDIQGYSILACQWIDMAMSHSEKLGLSSMLGTEDQVYNITGAAAAFATASKPTTAELNAMFPPSNRMGKALVDGTTYSFGIPLLHSLFALSEKMWPSFAFSDDTRIEITLSSNVQALVTSTAFVLKNPELVVDYIHFDSSVFPLIQETYKGRDLVISSQDYKYYSSQIASTTGNISQIIPCKVLSARAFFFAFRQASTQAVGAYTVSSRVNPFFTAGDSFNLNIGGSRVPNKPITTVTTGNFAPWFATTQSALHAMNSTEMNGCLNTSYYQKWPAASPGSLAGASSYQNAFALAINVDTLRGQSELSNSGLNLSAVTTYYEGNIGTAPLSSGGAATTISVDCHVLHDVLYIVDGAGNVSVRA